jgi:hypothetical protein
MTRGILAVAIAVVLTFVISGTVHAATSPAPNATGTGPAASATPTSPTYYGNNDPGDNHGSLGRTHMAFKVNSAVRFVNRSTGTANEYGDSVFWSQHTNLNLAVGATITFTTDGRIVYDPYPPSACSTSGGHWLAVEVAKVSYPDGTQQEGVLIGVSAGEDPTGPWYAIFDADPAQRSVGGCTANVNCPDFPMIGFNTSWIAVNTAASTRTMIRDLFSIPDRMPNAVETSRSWEQAPIRRSR